MASPDRDQRRSATFLTLVNTVEQAENASPLQEHQMRVASRRLAKNFLIDPNSHIPDPEVISIFEETKKRNAILAGDIKEVLRRAERTRHALDPERAIDIDQILGIPKHLAEYHID